MDACWIGAQTVAREAEWLCFIDADVKVADKVDWNTTQFDQKMPAPIKAARDVGRILKHIEFGAAISPDFRKFT